MNAHSPAHYTGMVFKVALCVGAWLLSLSFSLGFFFSIAPPDNPYFPYMGIALTEGGFAGWLAVFLLTEHKPFPKMIAGAMMFASAFTSFSLAGTQFYTLLQKHLDLQQVSWLYPTVSILLLGMMLANMLALVLELVAWYEGQPGHGFLARGVGDLIPTTVTQMGIKSPRKAQHQLQLLPQPQQVQVFEEEEEEVPYEAEWKEGVTATPLKRLPPMRDEGSLRQAASTAMKKVKGAMPFGKKGGHAPGAQNGTISGNGSTGE
jgi:hypothetical protein